jgi:hypothetical protein
LTVDDTCDEFSCFGAGGKFVQLHCLQYLILELVSGGAPKKVGSFFSATDTDIPSANLRQFENFFNQLAFFPHILDYRGMNIYMSLLVCHNCWWINPLLVWVFDFVPVVSTLNPKP